jgi:hypothetical protein
MEIYTLEGEMMAETNAQSLAVIDQQIKELDVVAKQTNGDLNTVAGAERITKWKSRTVALLAQQVGKKEADELAQKKPGPSFTSDLLEEFNDEVEFYRAHLTALAKRLRAAPPASAG